MDALCDDLAAEHADLDRVVDSGSRLSTPTPATGWTVGDQLSHLWFFDQRAVMAMADPEEFAQDARHLMAVMTESGGTDMSVEVGRDIEPDELLAGWRDERATLLAAGRAIDPRARIPWYGPAMSARSFITARLMETWAHGQDVVDAAGAARRATDRLRHIAQLGVITRGWSYAVRGMEAPEGDVGVVLERPAGGTWMWGPSDGPDRIEGPAEDFCLVVTQRRHVADTALIVTGPAAADWMAHAQAFAGGPTEGPAPRRSR